MNKKIIFLSIFLLSIGTCALAQPKNKPKSIITTVSGFKKYYDKSELVTLQKGELISLYTERIRLLVNSLPYIAMASKAGVTMTDIGIPDNAENRKALDVEQEASATFLASSIDFQTKMLPYCDKSIIITCILFYESTMKSLNTMNE